MTSDLSQKLKNSTICPLPWIGIETSPVGTARPCCLSRESIMDENNNVMKIRDHGLISMFESQYIKNLRKQMINGEKPDTCKLCWDEETVGRSSKRIHAIERFAKSLQPDMFQQTDYGEVKFVDLKLGNLCNLKCRICGSWSSSKWAKEEIDLYNSDTSRLYLKEGAWPEDSNQFWKDIEELLGQIDYLEITGGEPFMIENHFKFLRKAIETGDSKRIFVHYNTNGTNLPRHALTDIWPHFKMVEVAFSIDDLGERFEYQRYPANWNEVNNNLNEFWEYSKQHKNFTTQICCTVNIFNVLYLNEICDWILTKKFDYIYFNLLHGEPEWNIKNMPDNLKAQVRQNINLDKMPSVIREQLSKIFSFMDQPADISVNEIRRKKIDLNDSYRRENFLKTFPELKELYDF